MKPIAFIAVAVSGLLIGAAVGVGFKFVDRVEQAEPQSNLGVSNEASAVPDFSFPDTSGKLRHSREWKTRVLVLNFWAAWCPPCRKETPAFVELQEQYRDDNVMFVGIAIDDPQPVLEFIDTYAVNYPILFGDMAAVELSRRLGNRFEGLPYTIVAEPGGKVIMRHAGGLSREQLEPQIRRALESQRREPTPAS